MLPVRHADQGLHAFEPSHEFERLRRQMWSLLDSWPTLSSGRLLADLEETDAAFIAGIELPGVKKKDVTIELEGRRVIVHGERKERERSGVLRRQTRRVGEFHHEVVVPADVDEEGTEANLEEGVLVIRLPKAQSVRRRRIPLR